MTEAEWLASEDPVGMVVALRLGGGNPRKFALLAFAACRLIWGGLDEPSRRSLLAAELDEDGDWNAADDTKRFDHELRRQEVGVFCLRELQRQARHPEAAALVREIFGNPFRPVVFEAAWRTGAVVTLARGMYESRDFSQMPILADALEDAGCGDEAIIRHCRGFERCVRCGGTGRSAYDWGYSPPPTEPCPQCEATGWSVLKTGHARGCWVVDLVLGK